MKKKLLIVSMALFVSLSGSVYAAAKWNGYSIVKVFSGGKEVKASTPSIVIKGNTYIPLSMLKQMGISVTSDKQGVKVEMPPEKVKLVYALTQSQLEDLSQSVYKVLGSTSDPTTMNQGSGFIVGDTFITNWHVAGDSAYAQVEIDGQTQKVDKYQFANKDVDLMGFPVTGGKALPISTELPKPGDLVYAIGYPAGELKVTEGKVHFAAKSEISDNYISIVHSANIDNGSSGGVLLNGKGEAIGINRSGGGTVGDKVYSWAIPAMYLQSELNK